MAELRQYFKEHFKAGTIPRSQEIDKVKKILIGWKGRNLTLQGKVLVLKTFVLSSIGYLIEMQGIPDGIKKEVDKIMWNFLWDIYFCIFLTYIKSIFRNEFEKSLSTRPVIRFPLISIQYIFLRPLYTSMRYFALTIENNIELRT